MLSWVDTQTIICDLWRWYCHLVKLQYLCTLKWSLHGDVAKAENRKYIRMEDEKQKRHKKERWSSLPGTLHLSTLSRLWVMRNVHVLMEWKRFCAAPTSVFSEAEQPQHRRQSKYFPFTKKNGSVIISLILASEIKMVSRELEQVLNTWGTKRKQALNVSVVTNDRTAPWEIFHS